MSTNLFNNIFTKPFGAFILGFVGLELLSYLSWLSRMVFWGPINLGTIFFLAVILIFTVLTWKNLRWACYVALAEIIIGVHGYLLFANLGGKIISLRTAIFVILLVIWLIKNRAINKMEIWHSSFWPLFALYALVIAWGISRALISHNPWALILKDFQPWLFIFWLPMFISVLRLPSQFKTVFQLVLAGATVIAVKTIVLTALFAKLPDLAMTYIYPWLRVHYLAEVTPVLASFFRYFSAAQIYVLIAWFFLFISCCFSIKNPTFLAEKKITVSLLIIFSTALLISLSRSFWLGLIITIVFFLFFAWRYFKANRRQLTIIILKLFGLFIAANIIVLLTTNVLIINIFDQRISTTEAAATSRISQLIPLIIKINNHLIIGSGFGATFTFKSADPRILANSPTGLYTAYRSEWGYLDLWLKVGFAGLVIFCLLLGKVLKFFWQRLRYTNELPIRQLAAFGLLSLLAIIMVHATSPYLNHPLGIIWLLLETTTIKHWPAFYANESIS